MMILSVDPGHTQSAWVVYDGKKVRGHAKMPNEELLRNLREFTGNPPFSLSEVLVVEWIAAMGMAVGAEVFDTCAWTGRFIEAWEHCTGWTHHRVKRHEVKMHLCGNMRAKDGNIRAALIDRFGGAGAIGKKAMPGPLYGISGDCWSALAIGVTWHDRDALRLGKTGVVRA